MNKVILTIPDKIEDRLTTLSPNKFYEVIRESETTYTITNDKSDVKGYYKERFIVVEKCDSSKCTIRHCNSCPLNEEKI